MQHPYTSLPEQAYWRTAVADPGAYGISHLWNPKFAIKASDKIVTAGSCFAQHIGRALSARGYNWYDAEPAPAGLPNPTKFNYGVFSFRTGNIYTTALMRQWLEWSTSTDTSIASKLEIWEKDGRFFDAFRPAIEPNGFASAEEVIAARQATFAAIRRALKADIFVFTLGLTEAWLNSETGVVYAACPGTLAGEFDPAKHVFANFDVLEVEKELRAAIAIARKANPGIRFLLTVSPVPLTATASGDHVLVATTYSKSVLRAVAGRVSKEDGVDYFPSYEIITGAPFRGSFFAPNLREVVPDGVAFVMKHLFENLTRAFPSETAPATAASAKPVKDEDDVICEEMALEAFNQHE